MGQSALPLAKGVKHVAAFERAGWSLARVKGSHHILVKEGHEAILSIPCHNRDVKRALLGDLIKAAGLSDEEYVAHFRG